MEKVVDKGVQEVKKIVDAAKRALDAQRRGEMVVCVRQISEVNVYYSLQLLDMHDRMEIAQGKCFDVCTQK